MADETAGPGRREAPIEGHTHRPGNVRRHDPAEVVAASRPGRQGRPGRDEPSQVEVDRARTEQRRRRRRWIVVGGVLLVVAAVVIGLSLRNGPLTRALPWVDAQEESPFSGRAFYVASDTQAGQAAATERASGDTADAAVLERLAEVPTAVWLTPEALGPGAVGDAVRPVAEDALEQGAVVTFVVYGVTDRDCAGAESSGGLPGEQYAAWVGEIASALAAGEGHAVAVLEPDGLASTFDCPQVTDERVRLLAGAIGSLVDAGVPTYVDAGHSDWRSVDEMADLLQRVGADRVRGFATNVSAYQPDEAEREYAEALSAATGGLHYVVDTGRNGVTGLEGSRWCNPEPAGPFGEEPAVVDDGSHQDARLWIKPPGESDGSGPDCAGGPAAGTFWTERALAMAAASGWG